MADDTLKLPLIKLDIPKPKAWDFAALATLVAALAAAGANLYLALGLPPGQSLGDGATTGFALGQLVIACAGLLVLGKTAKLGTIWGNLLAVAAMMAGISGVLLAAALWSAA